MPNPGCEFINAPIDFSGRALGSPVRDGPGYQLKTFRLGYEPREDASAIFDTSNPPWNDRDLGSPNSKCVKPGPGLGKGGAPGSEGENCVPLGNVLIAHQGDVLKLRKSCEKCPTCKECVPNDNWSGANFNFTFIEKTQLYKIVLLDVDEKPKSVILTDYNGFRYQYEGFGDNGKLVIDLNSEWYPAGGAFYVHCAGSCAIVEIQRARCIPMEQLESEGRDDNYKNDGDVIIPPGPISSTSTSPPSYPKYSDDKGSSPTPLPRDSNFQDDYGPDDTEDDGRDDESVEKPPKLSYASKAPMPDYGTAKSTPSSWPKYSASPLAKPSVGIIREISGYDKPIEDEGMPCVKYMDTFREYETGLPIVEGEHWTLETCRKEWNKKYTCGVSAAFNTSWPVGDVDLGSPNEKCAGGGPGIGWGGDPKSAGANCERLGQVLIAAGGNTTYLRSVCPGEYCHPNDHAGGADFYFTFTKRSKIAAVAMMDLDEDPKSAAIMLGNTTENIRGLGDNSVQLISLNNVLVEKNQVMTIRCFSSCAIVRIDYYPCF